MTKAAPKTPRKAKAEYYCVAVRRNYEENWRVVSKHTTFDEAQAELESRRGYTGAFNYDNAELRVMSRTEAKKEFGDSWEYKPIGGVAETKTVTRRPARETD
jgi:hypothetical protein